MHIDRNPRSRAALGTLEYTVCGDDGKTICPALRSIYDSFLSQGPRQNILLHYVNIWSVQYFHNESDSCDK
jgi:hypothetical protein